ncbi:MAG: thioredoxin [Candidatus Accumulibacter appositus]|uniref:Thioredoxin n=1 Tax=Candidatus Accumulibacter appositus TaxID=1454003 RepID=A0A011NDD2_9PROT|nr:thioredoxin family protein [Accumulibacter sp.]EXI80703.1 MAG: thioredoxin [Candidatus Accumulibacter appositus]HRF06526.1 thioredoxin family protein [Accumulibacter sp.]
MASAERSTQPPQRTERGPALAEFVIVCLCAEWCGVCREYRDGFTDVARQLPAAGFHWLDIEEHADDLGDLDVENFPTLLIKRRELVLFYGAMLPTPSHLKRTIEVFLEQSSDESREYAFSNVERQGWQEDADLRRLNAVSLGELCHQS